MNSEPGHAAQLATSIFNVAVSPVWKQILPPCTLWTNPSHPLQTHSHLLWPHLSHALQPCPSTPFGHVCLTPSNKFHLKTSHKQLLSCKASYGGAKPTKNQATGPGSVCTIDLTKKTAKNTHHKANVWVSNDLYSLSADARERILSPTD